MTIRGWLILGGKDAAAYLPTSAALVGPLPTPILPNAAEVEVGRWILWQPLGLNVEPLCLVCIEAPM